MDPTSTNAAPGYRATRSGGDLVIHGVPIFVECSRGDVCFDGPWIAAAVARAKQSESEGYLPPLHIRHHEPSTDANNAVRAAGYFRITGTSPITFKGNRTTAVIADLIITDPDAQAEVLARRLPYRSVEIFDIERPSLDGLALLDHEAPFLELPMLMVSDVDGQTPTSGHAQGTFAREWSMSTTPDGAAIACFRRGKSAHFLFQDEAPMAEPTESTPKQEILFKDDDAPDEKKGEDMEGGGIDAASVAKAIESGEITVAEMDLILAAIQAQKSEAPTEDVEEEPAPAAVPGAESMTKRPTESSAQFARLQGENEALKARMDARDATDLMTTNVSTAMKRLEGRPLGADLEGRLVKFHKEHGAAPFADYVDAMESTTPALPGDDGKGAAFQGQIGKVPDVAMAYQSKGTDAIDMAAKYANEWRELHDSGHTRVGEERYVALNMERNQVRI